MATSKDEIRDQFWKELKHHLEGWLEKVSEDFSEAEFKRELADLKRDPVYSGFGFAIPEYVLVRLIGRVSISIGRRLGEIYDKIPRLITHARFGLTEKQVAPKMGQKLQLDVCIPIEVLSKADAAHVTAVARAYLHSRKLSGGLGIEIRYNFNPNDSARLRKDVDMANFLKEARLLPVYLIFSTISPRDDAIARLKRAGWTFLIGNDASKFMQALIGMNFKKILEEVRDELDSQVAKIMRQIYTSYAMRRTLEPYRKQ
ncbi:MAG TPA: hypothetical protein VJS89_05520 [Gammaproteobacteria bacterium]|nr:hypothetical protein [Gammaproteobacteria bacterium]